MTTQLPFGDVVVLLPGITGSVLQQNGKDVWALSGGALGRGLLSLAGSVKNLALDGDDPALDDLGDGVTADRLIDGATIIPRLWSIDGYRHISETLCHDLNLTPGGNYFEFPYDWRRDNRVAARRLSRLAPQWLESWQKQTKNPRARLVLVGHSMGGLIARYFIEVLKGWRITRKLLTLGTPHRGSLNSVDFLANGYYGKKLGRFGLVDLSELLRSFTSVYQLLPIYPCIDPGDGVLVRPCETDIPNMNMGRVSAADSFYREIEHAIGNNKLCASYRDDGYETVPFVGSIQPTHQMGRLKDESVEMLGKYPTHNLQGDGTVPQSSAYPIEWEREDIISRRIIYAPDRHSALQNGAAVLANLKGILGAYDVDLGSLRGATGLSLDIADIFGTDEAVTCALSLSTATNEGVRDSKDEKLDRLSVQIENVDTGMCATEQAINARRSKSAAIDLGKLREGTYRLTARRPRVGRTDDTVSELFLVLPVSKG